ncbi:MAG: nitrate reductase subunit alpha, partial [Deltaproteobacteria bacterium]
DYDPRGCPRGASFSGYVYSPMRLKYPYIRSGLLRMWRESLRNAPRVSPEESGWGTSPGDPVAAWAAIVEDDEKRRQFQKERGKGGFVRVSREEALTLVAASLVYTIKKYGPDRIFGFTPIPAMSMVGYCSGARFISLIGGAMLSFYDWYSDLPPASPQIWGDQTDVPVSADWYQSTYIVSWGANIPMTRTPDAHFYSEVRYKGAKVVAVSPDYGEYVKFADTWLPAKAGTDSALAMAMTYVVLKEFYVDKQTDYFTSYAKAYTDCPFAVVLKKREQGFVSDRFLRAEDLGIETPNAEWKTVYYDALSASFVVPNGSIGFRWSDEGKWNLRRENSLNGSNVDPVLSFHEQNDGWVTVDFPHYSLEGPQTKTGTVPIKKIRKGDEELVVTTVLDLLLAHVGIDRTSNTGAADDYDDPRPYTPAWQEAITGVPRESVIHVAREFAENAARTRGRSMIILGSGINHWFHADMNYRTILNLTTLCGCQGVNGGGWAHYTGQEKVRPLSAWATIAFALDWLRPPRRQNGTSFFYFATDQWRYDLNDATTLASPLADTRLFRHPADYNVMAARLGWLPWYPQFNRNSLDLFDLAEGGAGVSHEEVAASIARKLKSRELKTAIEDPDAPESFPRVMFFWRANVLGASAKGHEYFLKHLLGTHNAVMGSDRARAEQVVPRDPAPEGKLDLLVTLDFRMSTSALYSDVVLPAATWYEMNDLSTTDLHPFIHPFTAAIDPPWEAKQDWDHFKLLAEKFAEMAKVHLGERTDVVAVPLLHDTPGELSQPRIRDWLHEEVDAVPGKNMANLVVVNRDYPNVDKMFASLGPILGQSEIGAKGAKWKPAQEYELLRKKLGTIAERGISYDMPSLERSSDVAEAILALAPETNGRVAVRAWSEVEQKSGLNLAHLSKADEGRRFDFAGITAQPRRIITSPTWSGIESEERTYAPFVINIEQKLPFRTLTGRAHLYQDHEWMLLFGEALPLFRPPIDYTRQGMAETGLDLGNHIVLNYLTPHSKWSIHSTYAENLTMMTLFRGGKILWINNEDAEAINVEDNDWIECFNVNGLVLARAAVSHRIPRGKAFMYHAQERLVDTPVSGVTGETGGMHNSVTQIVVKPTHMIGAYAHLSYDFNYYGPTGSQRDTVVVVRKATEVSWHERQSANSHGTEP